MGHSVVLIGKESVGKSQLIRSLTGKNARSERIKGTTISVQTYQTEAITYIDTPGILTNSDTLTSQMAIDQIADKDCVALVITATSIDQDLADLLPLVHGRLGIVIITHFDKMKDKLGDLAIQRLKRELGVPLFAVDARHICHEEQVAIEQAIQTPQPFKRHADTQLVHVSLAPEKTIFDIPVIGDVLSVLLLFFPAWFAVQLAVQFSDSFYDGVFATIAPVVTAVNQLPAPLNYMLGMDYGIITMFPFLILYALPTVFFFAVIWSIYKTSGLIDTLTVRLHRWIAPFGLAGRDIVRVIMGFGCNVPAVISTRSCSSCTRGNCISAISFGAACSYQLPATIAVFVAINMDFLVIPYLVVLLITTLIYLWLTTSAETKSRTRQLNLYGRDFLQWPTLGALYFEMAGLIREFLTVALPIFIVICLIAGAMDYLNIISGLAWLLSPVMALFNLPPEAATAVVLGSIRKDGIAIGLLNPAWDGLKVPLTSPVQVLTAVYLAGVMLPCLVTLFTVVREMGGRFAAKLAGRQMIAAIGFAMVIAWVGQLVM